MKVIFITSESMLDHSYTMINELRKHVELKPHILAKNLTPELEEYCANLNVKFIRRFSFKNPASLFKEFMFLLALRRENADLVWFNRTTFYQTLLIKFMLRRYLINVHDVILHPEEKDYHGIITQKLIFRFFRKHIAIMSNTQAAIFENLYNIKPYMLQLPIIDYYKNVSPALPKTLQENKVKFFFFGSVMPYKGIEMLIDASFILAKKHENFEVNIFGKINYNHDELLKKISENGKIKLVNEFIDYKDIAPIFASNDVIVIPYIQVSQCGPLLIAYAQNVPVICSRLPGFSEYVEEGKSGLLFENSPESLAEKMEMFITNHSLKNEMESYIQNEIHVRFSMEGLANDYISVFIKIAGSM